MGKFVFLLLAFVLNFAYAIEKPVINSLEIFDESINLVVSDQNSYEKLIVLRLENTLAIKPSSDKEYYANAEFGSVEDVYATGKGNFIVYLGVEKKIDLKLKNLVPEKNYVLDFYYFDVKDKNKILLNDINGNNLYTLAPEPIVQGASIVYHNTSSNFLDFSWNKKNAEGSIVIVSTDSFPEFPKDGQVYLHLNKLTKENMIGKNSYVVYSGEKNSIKIDDLEPNKRYFIRICNYNGNDNFRNYNINNTAGNPSNKQTKLVTPKLFDPKKENNVIKFVWTASKGAEYFEFDIATDFEFKEILPEFKNIDVGLTNEWEFSNLPKNKELFFRLRAKTQNNTSNYSNVVKIK